MDLSDRTEGNFMLKRRAGGAQELRRKGKSWEKSPWQGGSIEKVLREKEDGL